MLFSSELYEFLEHGYLLLFVKRHVAFFSNVYSTFARFLLLGKIVVNYPNIGKTLNSIDLVNLMSSISVRFNSFLFLYSIFNERNALTGSEE